MWKIIFFFFVVIIILPACEEIIDIDVEDIEQKIVIDGSITDVPGASRVIISMTDNIFRSKSDNKVYGAIVSIKDDTGNSETLVETESGKFSVFSLSAEYGRTYTLKVEIGNKVYSGSSTLNQPMQIDQVKFIKTSSYSVWGFPFDIYKMKMYLKNKIGIDEYCIIKIYDGQTNSLRNTIVYQDKYADDRQIILEVTNSGYRINETVNIEVLTVDKAAYEFFFQLNELSEESGIDVPDIFNINNYNPKSNLSNGALGCFYAYSSKRYKFTVK